MFADPFQKYFTKKNFFGVTKEAVAVRCSVKKEFLKISQNSQKNT